jgi:putative ABC transport system permease protein
MPDLRYAARVLWRTPGFTLVAAGVLALGIGANSAIFSVVDAALLRPLPYRQPQDLVMLWEHPPGHDHNRVSPLNFQDWHDRNGAFSAMAAVSGGSRTLISQDGAELIPGQAVTSELFSMLGVRPVAGRFFGPQDEHEGAALVVLGETLWRTHFGGDPALPGRNITLDGKPYTVVGIAPAGFQIFRQSDLWTLFVVKRSPEQRRMHYLQVLGRLKPGVTLRQADAAMAGLAAGIARISPETNQDWGIQVEPLREAVVGGDLRSTTLVLAAVVALVLLLACANVANLMLARGTARAREMAVRVSLGASGSRLARQLLSESLLLAAAGGAGGLALAWVLIQAAPRLIPEGAVPSAIVLALDGRVAGFTAAVTLATGVLFGLAPVWQATRRPVAEGMRMGDRGSSGGNSRLLGWLAMVEIAIAVLVVAGAGLFVRTLERLDAVDPGYRAERVLTARVSLPLSRYPTPAALLAFYRGAQRELDSLPGITSVSLGGSPPLAGWDIGMGFHLPGDTTTGESHEKAAHYQIVGGRYFETLGIPLQAGRTFADTDDGSAPPVAIVNQEFARRYFPGGHLVGAHVMVQALDNAGPRAIEREIVGVVGQVKVEAPGEKENAIEIYVPITQNPWYWASIVARAPARSETLAAAMKAAIARVDPNLPVTGVHTMDEIAASSVARPRFRARLLGGFAMVAMLLAAVGIFGVLAFSVSRRRREFGIRMALGAQTGDVLTLVLGRGIKIAAGGIAFGLAGAALLAGSASSLLFGVEPLDAASFLFAGAALAAVTVAAASVPAWRATKVDPAVTLREE